MATQGPRPDSALEQSGLHVVNVFRLDPGHNATIRTLSNGYGGLFTHYNKRSWYCQGDGLCLPNLHRLQRVWKGYAAVEVYYQPLDVWCPKVLEITEHCELDFRGQWQRGQVWELQRDMPTDKRKPPVRAIFLEDREGRGFPPAFDVRPVLIRFYHQDALDLTKENPLPPRTILPVSMGDGPAHLKSKAQPAETPEARAEQGKKFRDWMHSRGVPVKGQEEEKPAVINGKH